MSAYEYQAFITIDINLLSFSKVLHDASEMNNMLNLIKEIIYFDFVRNKSYRVSNAYLPFFRIHITVEDAVRYQHWY